jgi:hypothetical protein
VPRIGLGGALEQLAGLGYIAPLHHSQPQLVQYGRVSGRHLGRARQQLVGFIAAPGGARSLRGLQRPEDRAVIDNSAIHGLIT